MKLIIINGPCGVGKSTVAGIVHQALPMSLFLDIDSQRRLFSNHKENSEKSTPLAQAISLSMARTALDGGCDVIVDKMQYFPDWYDQWIELGKEKRAQTLEFILWASKKAVLARADQRGYRPAGQPGGSLTREKVENFWEEMNKFKNTHPSIHTIDVEQLAPELAARQILEISKSD